jgi:hypothetical protein
MYAKLAEQLPKYANELKFSHADFPPPGEYNFDGVIIPLLCTRRQAGSNDFQLPVDGCHQEGFSVILNWVAVQSPDDQQAPVRFDRTAPCEHPDLREQMLKALSGTLPSAPSTRHRRWHCLRCRVRKAATPASNAQRWCPSALRSGSGRLPVHVFACDLRQYGQQPAGQFFFLTDDGV